MQRTFCACVILLAAFLPGRRPAGAVEHFPLVPGMSWEYGTFEFGELRARNRLEVESARPDGVWVLRQPGNPEPLLFALDGDRVLSVVDDNMIVTRSLFLDFSVEEGESWDFFCGTSTLVSRFETVTVPAGEFTDCVLIRTQTTCVRRPIVSIWYAPGVGRVKSASGSTTDELLSWEPVDAFIRGDVDADGNFNITDPVFLLEWLFKGGRAPPCLESGDVDADGSVVLTDAVFALNFLFITGGPPADPFPKCERSDVSRFSCEQGPVCGE